MSNILPFGARGARARLHQARQQHQLVRLWRGRLEQGSFCGYVGGVGREFFLMRVVGDTFTDEGLYAMRHRDVTRMETPEAHHRFIEKALQIKGVVAEFPSDFRLDATRDVIDDAIRRAPVLGVHVDSEDDNEVCYIGRLIGTEDDGFSLQEIDADAKWLREASFFAWDEVSTVSMHDPYAEVLHAVAGTAPALDTSDDGRGHGS